VTGLEIDTPHGLARAHLHVADEPVGALVLGHGAAGGVSAPDLVAVTDIARSARFSVALVEQPYRVAGRRSPAPAQRLDAAWTAVVEHLRSGELRDLPLIVGGRSAGARVACRTAADTGAVAVLCLAFPLEPPRRSAAAKSKNRQPELDAVQVPTLVVQGDRDPFGTPPSSSTRTVVTVPGNHSLKTDLEAVAAAVRDWLQRGLGSSLRLPERDLAAGGRSDDAAPTRGAFAGREQDRGPE
jgi:predicted alpha/beta-hydrolase family hydrolase